VAPMQWSSPGDLTDQHDCVLRAVWLRFAFRHDDNEPGGGVSDPLVHEPGGIAPANSACDERVRFVAGHVCNRRGSCTIKTPAFQGSTRHRNVLVRAFTVRVCKSHETIRSRPTSSAQRCWRRSASRPAWRRFQTFVARFVARSMTINAGDR
jgi:hypothetical protein